MNKLLLLGGLLLQSVAGWGQQFATLSGEVSHPTADTVSVSWRAEPFAAREQLVTAHLDRRGRFELQVPLMKPIAARLVYDGDDTPLFLEPGDALRFSFQSEELVTTLKVKPGENSPSRKAANANTYLTAFENAFANNEAYQVLPENITLLESAFLSFLDYRRSKEMVLLREMGGISAFTEAFQAHAEAEIIYAYANDRLTYQALRQQVVTTGLQIAVRDDYYDFLKDPQLLPGPENAPASDQYEDFILNYIHYQVNANGIKPSNPSYYVACYRLARRQFLAGARVPLLGQVLAECIRFGHLAHTQALLNDFATLAPPAAVATLQQDFADHRSQAIGAPAPPLPLCSPHGDSLQLSPHKGKLVYIMFWDSRLALSQRELPYLKDQAERYADQPVVFISAALDKDSAAWHRSLNLMSPAGVQAWVPAAAQAAVRAAYGLQQLPAFVLLDETGLILDPRPKRLSSRALQDDLKEYMGRAAAYRAVPLPKPGKGGF